MVFLKDVHNARIPFQAVDYRLNTNVVSSKPVNKGIKDTIRSETLAWEILYSELELQEELWVVQFQLIDWKIEEGEVLE